MRQPEGEVEHESQVILPWNNWRQAERESGLVSIVIPVFNEPELTEHCIHALFSVGANVSFELVCVDNGSSVPTQTVLSELVSIYRGSMRIVRNSTNLNFAVGCNVGFGHARGEIVVFLNNDTEVQPGWLDALVRRLSVGDCYGVQPQLRYPDGTLQCMGIVFSEHSTLGYPIYADMSPAECNSDKPRQFKALTAACIALRANDFARIRGFDGIFINGQEDVDLCLRLHQLTGKLGAYEPTSVVIHQESKSEGRFRRVDHNRKIFVNRWKGSVVPDDLAYYREDGFAVADWRADSDRRERSLQIFRPTLEPVSLISSANEAFRAGDYASAASLYTELALSQRPAFPGLEGNFAVLRRRWLNCRSRDEVRPRVGVCSWSLAHNPAGRAMTLAEAYEPHAEVAIVGCLVPQFGTELWAPLRGSEIPCHYFTVASGKMFVRQALELVARHPFDIVHLSKPRIHNVIFGWLYQLVWGARVIMDVDDEELAFVKADSTLDPFDYINEHGSLPSLKSLRTQTWTRLAVGMVDQFDGVTVSNPALQQRYGGQVLAHVRPGERFNPSPELRLASRKEFGVPIDKRVVLFYGTPRKHKGIVETARALAELGRGDVCYVIAGGEPDAELKSELETVSGVDYIFLGPQPYERTPDVVAMGDVCLLLQDVDSYVAQFQLPAKLMDALGMGLTVFAQVTPALEELAHKGAFIPVTPDNLVETLRGYFEGRYDGQGATGRALFETELTVEAVAPTVRGILADESRRRATSVSWEGQLDYLLKGLLPKGVPLPHE